MSLRCFYVVDGSPVGPVSTDDLTTLARTGAFAPDTLVWIEGTADWQPYAAWSMEAEPIAAARTEPPPPELLEPPPEPETNIPSAVEPITSLAPKRVTSLASEPVAPSAAEPVASFAAETATTSAHPASDEPVAAANPLPMERVEPAPAAAPKDGRIFRILSWLSLLLLALFLLATGILLAFFPDTALEGLLAGKAFGALRLLLALSVLAGLGALFGFRRYQNWQVIAPASVALAINVVLFFIAIPAVIAPEFLRSRQRSRGIAVEGRSGNMSPVKSVPGATRVSHPTLGFSFDVPAGFEERPLTKSSAKLWKLFGRPAGPGELAEVFGIQPLGAKLPLHHLDIRQIPTDANVNLGRLSWRGVEIDAIRISEAKDGKNYVTYNVQVPLKGEAIQLMFGAPREREAELKARIETLLASLEGQSDW